MRPADLPRPAIVRCGCGERDIPSRYLEAVRIGVIRCTTCGEKPAVVGQRTVTSSGVQYDIVWTGEAQRGAA